jgi:hypothetical protein
MSTTNARSWRKNTKSHPAQRPVVIVKDVRCGRMSHAAGRRRSRRRVASACGGHLYRVRATPANAVGQNSFEQQLS